MQISDEQKILDLRESKLSTPEISQEVFGTTDKRRYVSYVFKKYGFSRPNPKLKRGISSLTEEELKSLLDNLDKYSTSKLSEIYDISLSSLFKYLAKKRNI